MKKLIVFGILLFIVSVGVGYIYSKFFVDAGNVQELQFSKNTVEDISITNEIELKTIEAIAKEEKVVPNTEFAIKQYYDECGHFKFEYADLPKELINFTIQEIEDYYNNQYEVEKFENNSLVISKEINGLCDNHFFIKLGDENIEIYRLNTDGSFALYEETEISREYLPINDIQALEEGMYVYGEGKINAAIEDFE